MEQIFWQMYADVQFYICVAALQANCQEAEWTPKNTPRAYLK